MKSYGPRQEPDGTQHMRVAQAREYPVEIVHYRRRVAGGVITCRTRKSRTPGRRIVQLTANYLERGIDTQRVVQCESQEEEMRQLERLERIILEASRSPTR